MAPASARIVAMPLPIPRLAPVTTTTVPVRLLFSMEPMMRVADDQDSCAMALGPETPGTQFTKCFVRPKGASAGGLSSKVRNSGFGRKQAQVALAAASPRLSPAWRKSSNDSLAALSPSPASPSNCCAPATAFNAAACPALSSSPLKSSTATEPSFNAALPTFSCSCTSASVCEASASPLLLPVSLKSFAASSAFSSAACGHSFNRYACAINRLALALPSMSFASPMTVSKRVAARNACSPAVTMRNALAMLCSTAASVFLSSISLHNDNASLAVRNAISG
mmetsp:Transcript_100145/g.323001  ORF Transcript_100145/g.323001 Transcript_100145/m.323001 type:complete len:281 (+) Transcript_100145:970-1812(+)